jgi:hypothetical protein
VWRLAALAFVLVAGSALAQEAMTGDELEALLGKDETISLGGPGAGYEGELAFKADGTATGTAKTDKGEVIQIDGVWYIEGNKFCRIWKGIDGGKEVCETWIKDGENKARVLVDGKEIGVNHWL